MTLPVSSYEELLARVRSLTSETIQLRREITSSLCDPPVIGSSSLSANTNYDHLIKNYTTLQQRISVEDVDTTNTADLRTGEGKPVVNAALILDRKENELDNEFKEIDEKLTSPDTPVKKNSFYRNGWAPDIVGLWHSGPSSLNLGQSSNQYAHQDLTSSVTYNSYEPQSLNTFSSSSKRTYSHHQLGAKVEMVYSLLSMLDTDNREDMSKTFLAMSSSAESCHAMRQGGCLPLLIQLIHSPELNQEVRKRAAEALHNIVHAQTDEKRRRREVRILKLLQQVREYCDELKNTCAQETSQLQQSEKHPVNAIGTLMKFSFDAEHRQAICILGGLHAITELIQVDHEAHGSTTDNTLCITLRRYAGMSLTNLTFGDGKNKALLCSFSQFMRALVDQLKSPSEDLRQVTASVLRNLSWRADSESKQSLRNVNAVTALIISAMEGKKESTLKSVLSALWNLSAHCSLNKVDICSVPGALAFLVKMLRYKSSSNTLAIVENAGGILRNISSHIAVREDYRQILRDNNCFEILLEQLKSPSLTIVSNACGTLWNLSARCPEDQKRLWEMGATSMLRSLVQSKHKMISMGSSAALKNLLAANPNENLLTHLDSTAKSLGLQNLPTLFVRKKRALEHELNITLAETCENIDPVVSPTHFIPLQDKAEDKKANIPRRSDSRDSVQSTQSDSAYERINQITLKNEEKLFENKNVTLHDSLDEKSMPQKVEDQKLMRRYKTSMIPTATFKKMNQDRINEKTREGTFVEGSVNEPAAVETNCKARESLGSKEKSKKGILVLNTGLKSKIIQSYEVSGDNCSSRNNFFPSSVEECNAKNEENESFRENVIEKHHNTTSTILKSQVDENYLDSDLGNTSKPLSSHFRVKEIFESPKHQERNKNHESWMNSGDLISNTDLSNALSNETNCSDDKNSSEKMNIPCSNNTCNEFDGKINERSTCEDKISNNCSLSSFKDLCPTAQCVAHDENSASNHSSLVPDKSITGFQGQDLKKEFLLGINVLPKDSASENCQQNIKKLSSPQTSNFYNSKDSVKKIFNANESSDTFNAEVNQSGFLCQKTESNENSFYTTKTFDQEKRFDEETCRKPIHDLLSSSQNLCQQSLPRAVLEEVSGTQNENLAPDTMSSAQDETKKPNCTSDLSASVNQVMNMAEKEENLLKERRTEISFPLDSCVNFSESPVNEENELEKFSIINNDGVDLKTFTPNFKVGSPITDSRALQIEANKICREIKKHQDFEMGCSLTSEASLISCSSFLDTGDYSLFESSTDVVDFDDSENMLLSKASSKIKNFASRKPATSQTAESISLPSLGSLKNEQIEALDLDNSVLSVASITSEIAETYSKDLENYNTYTKTYKIDPQNEFTEETVADATLVSSGDDTLNADSLQNNTEIFDEDNSLHSQENLPLDAEPFQDPADRMKKKLTPKEKRKTFHERYRTYTIRNFQGCKNPEITSAISGQGSNTAVTKDILLNCVYNSSQNRSVDGDFDEDNFDPENENDYVKMHVERQKPGSSSTNFYSENKHETFHLSKSFDKERDLVSANAFDSGSLTDLLDIGPAERKELVDNAKLVAFSLKTAVQDFEVMSDSEIEEPRKSIDIDTATYNKSYRDRSHGKISSQGSQSVQHYEECAAEDLEKKGAKILKPNDIADDKLEELTKGIRGRRKPLYSSQKNSLKANESSVNSPKGTQMQIEAKKSLSDACKSVGLHREGTFTKEDGPDLKKVEAKNSRTIPVLHRNFESKSVHSSRPVSKSKSGPPAGTSKRFGDTQISKIGRPLSTYMSKNIEKRPESDSSQKRPFSAGAVNRATGGDNGATSKKSSGGLASPKMRNSSSNQNIKSGSNLGTSYSVKSRNLTLQNSKSQSDASLNLVVSKDKVSLSKQKTPKKEVTSKIASLWRKVEETKQKNKNFKDNRVWICPEKNVKTGDEILVIEKEEILDIPTRKIVHSYTCQTLADEASTHFNFQERSSADLKEVYHVEIPEEKRGKIERRNIISAVVSPYNYNPPVSVQISPSKMKQVDTFHKGSLKHVSQVDTFLVLKR